METGRQSYIDILRMPVIAFQGFIQWKNDLEEEKAKLMGGGNGKSNR